MSSTNTKFKFETLAIHAGQAPDPATGAIMTPIYQTSTFVQSSPGKFIDNYDYARSSNPTRVALEQNIAALERGIDGICFSSGCAAMDAVLHLLNAGDHVILCDDVYGGTFRLFDKVFRRHGLEISIVDMSRRGEIAANVGRNTKLVWIETPTNPMLKVIDLESVYKEVRSKSKNALICVDNTFSSPYLQNPLEFGADIVCHSSTKYLGGHSDLVGGVLVVKDKELGERLHYLQNAVGGVPGPMDAFLVLRSTKTLALRMERHCENAMTIAEFLSAHRKVKRVIYPGLKSHPQHRLARKQMRSFGGMISVELKGGLSDAVKVLKKVKIFALAESLGGVESLIEHPAIMTHASIPQHQRKLLGIGDSLIRLSVGLENVEDLISDLDSAL